MLSAIGFHSSIKQVGTDAIVRPSARSAADPRWRWGSPRSLPGRGVLAYVISAELDRFCVSNLRSNLTSCWFLRLYRLAHAPYSNPSGRIKNESRSEEHTSELQSHV